MSVSWLISPQSPEATVVQLFTEVRRHKPSVIYIPNVNTWYETVGKAVISTFLSLLRTLAPTDPVLVLGIVECDERDIDRDMIRDFFYFSRRNLYDIPRPLMVSLSGIRLCGFFAHVPSAIPPRILQCSHRSTQRFPHRFSGAGESKKEEFRSPHARAP